MAQDIKKIKEIISKIPFEPGIYMMKDEKGKIIYVGKAISLRKRVRQYFQKNNKSARIEKMTTLVHDISYIVTKNEVEALVLECNYIKENRPKFNVMLKDDKSYPYIKVTIKDKYPTVFITRRKLEDSNLYFGPYTNIGAVRNVLNMLKQIFPLKRCKINLEKNKNRNGCLYYHIGRCVGPCMGNVNLEEYRKMIDQVVLFLQGKTAKVENMIREEIDECIKKLEFEKAQKLKERLDEINVIKLKQNVDNLSEVSTDIFGYVKNLNSLYIQIFKIRNHRVSLHDNLQIDDIENENIDEILTQVVSSYYLNNNDIPKKVYVKIPEENANLIMGAFATNNLNTNVIVPKRGEKLELIRMVENNININLADKKETAVDELAEIIDFKEGIDSIECYDISNLRNDYIVGCMIRFEDKKLNKKMYRKFRIKSTLTQDDPKCMYEVITRRLKHSADWPLPDLILIDGGKTQLKMVKKAFEDSNESCNIFGMVKNDKHRTRGLIDIYGNEYNIKENKKVLNFLTFLQDEVHRFTITYHRSLRDKIK